MTEPTLMETVHTGRPFDHAFIKENLSLRLYVGNFAQAKHKLNYACKEQKDQ